MDRLVLEPLFIPSVQSHQEGALRVAPSNFFSTPTEKGSSYLQHHRNRQSGFGFFFSKINSFY
ncbi:unnamed protein product [Tenebrio molitor]|nr:unnamed protein product [Tenebrio molitor]